jgi:hypothetical protein
MVNRVATPPNAPPTIVPSAEIDVTEGPVPNDTIRGTAKAPPAIVVRMSAAAAL